MVSLMKTCPWINLPTFPVIQHGNMAMENFPCSWNVRSMTFAIERHLYQIFSCHDWLARVHTVYLFLGGVWELLFLGSTMVLINFLVHGKCEISSNFGQSYFEFDVKTWTSPDLLPNRFGSNQNLFSEKQFESKIHSIVKNDAVIWHEIETDFI
jgi:hypothetical protein